MDMRELTQQALELNLEGVGTLSRHDLLFEILRCEQRREERHHEGRWRLEVMSDGYGFCAARTAVICLVPKTST
jgi:transcription termination factor Rho